MMGWREMAGPWAARHEGRCAGNEEIYRAGGRGVAGRREGGLVLGWSTLTWGASEYATGRMTESSRDYPPPPSMKQLAFTFTPSPSSSAATTTTTTTITSSSSSSVVVLPPPTSPPNHLQVAGPPAPLLAGHLDASFLHSFEGHRPGHSQPGGEAGW